MSACSADELRAALAAGESGPLRPVMMAFSRPTRIVRGKEVSPDWAVTPSKFELPEEAALWEAYSSVAVRVTPGMALPAFLEACQALLAPIDGFFEKVSGGLHPRLALFVCLSYFPGSLDSALVAPGSVSVWAVATIANGAMLAYSGCIVIAHRHPWHSPSLRTS